MNKALLIFNSKRNALILTAFAAVCTLLVSATYVATRPIIAHQAQLNILNQLKQVLEPELYDNVPVENCALVSDTLITGGPQKTIYRATLNGEPSVVIIQTETKQGYNGLIEIMASVTADGTVKGVRILSHQETPGLGDKVELAKSNWVLSFNNQHVQEAQDRNWFVKKDGGKFDQFTGATITPRAVVNQLRQAVWYTQQNFAALFELQNTCTSQNQTGPVENEVNHDS